jgi:chromatin structure-remodeling complex protein RSC7
MMFYPTTMQPTHAKWEQIPPQNPTDSSSQQHHLTNGSAQTNGEPSTEPTIFSTVPPVVSRNYAVIDTTYTAPPISNAGFPGPDGTITDPTSGSQGLSTIPSDILDELPEDCRQAFEAARAAEVGWKQQWGTEAQSGMRGGLKIGFSGYPV